MLQGQEKFGSTSVNTLPNNNKALSPKSSADFLPAENNLRGKAAPSLSRV